ncbi:MAG: hypothetical protein ACLUB2_00790 [Butyricicoccus pullicaecorum]
MLAEGIGEVLSPCGRAALSGRSVEARLAVSTAAVYAQIDDHMPDVRLDGWCVSGIAQGDYNGVCRRLYNVMEAVTAVRTPGGQIRALLSCGADGAAMSGSGPTTSVYSTIPTRHRRRSIVSRPSSLTPI